MAASVHHFVQVSHSLNFRHGTKAIEKVMMKITIKKQITDAGGEQLPNEKVVMRAQVRTSQEI